MTDSELYEWFERKAENTPMPGAHEAFLSAADAFKERIERNNGWISVEDELPNEGKNVLIYIPFKDSHLNYVAYMESGLWYVPTMYGRSSLDDVTHWQYLPTPPKEGK